eukprot:jgi/Undpi1/7123/HiC_scaffold_22.g09597.m1
MDSPQLAAKIPTDPGKALPRNERRGSVLRREALERIQQVKGGPYQNEGTNLARGEAADAGASNDFGAQGVQSVEGLVLHQNRRDIRHAPEPTGGLGMAWGEKPPPPRKPRKRRGSSSRSGREGVGYGTTVAGDGHGLSGVDREGIEEDLRQRAEAMKERRTSRRRESVLRANVSLGFPRNPAVESLLETKAREADAARTKTEEKLHRLLDHRRRLLDVLQASQAYDKDFRASSNILRSELPQAVRHVSDDEAVSLVGMNCKGGNKASVRRSSLDNLKDLAKELMDGEASTSADDRLKSPAVDASASAQETASEKKTRNQLLNKALSVEKKQGWREVMEMVFSGGGKVGKGKRVGGSRAGAGGDGGGGRGYKDPNIWGFMVATTAREHVEFLIAAMNPARAQDLPAVVECFLRHYTGAAADELDIFLGGRVTATEIQCLVEMTLSALDTVHIRYVPSVLMLQWLLARAPHLRALLLKGGVLRRAFRRLEKAEAKGYGPGEKAMQYGALSLVIGISFS